VRETAAGHRGADTTGAGEIVVVSAEIRDQTKLNLSSTVPMLKKHHRVAPRSSGILRQRLFILKDMMLNMIKVLRVIAQNARMRPRKRGKHHETHIQLLRLYV
jgi:hypothetical protein